jgi:hypothetical protein
LVTDLWFQSVSKALLNIQGIETGLSDGILKKKEKNGPDITVQP